jgi:glucose/arabinose dehydrogenase/mono/diheme cytochrome c family protein
MREIEGTPPNALGKHWTRVTRLLLLVGLFCLQSKAERVTNQTLNLPLQPERRSFALEAAFLGVQPILATTAVSAPGDTNRLFILEKNGQLLVITNLSQPTTSKFLDLTSKTAIDSESGLLGMAFHPQWKSNGSFFIFYSTVITHEGVTGLHQRVSRFQIDPQNPNAALPDSEKPLISQFDPDAAHNAGDLAFGPDGYLYISLGDGGGAFDSFKNSQDIQKDFFSGILRVDVDNRPESLLPNSHPAIHSGSYRVPPSNPFLNITTFFQQNLDPSKVRTEFYAIGLRNPFRIEFDPATGTLWANDVGQNRREEIDLIEPGANYGWIIFEGSVPWPYQILDEPYKKPVFEYEHELGKIAITGGLWYHGTQFPELTGSYIFADLGGPVGALTLSPSGSASVRWIANQPGITDVMLNPQTGEILFTTINDGVIRKLVRVVQEGPPIPPFLSQTGIFRDLAQLRPNPGVEPYSINVPFWSDNAIKTRWFCLPKPDLKIEFAATAPWQTPESAVWVKHFELNTDQDDPNQRRRVETRVLVRSGSGHKLWGATYRWNEAQTDAELVPEEGMDENILVREGDLIRIQKWRYPGRDECLNCHNEAAGGILGFNSAQLNLDLSDGIPPTNQLGKFLAAGYFNVSSLPLESLPRLADKNDSRWSLDYRVHSYLAANCANCHRPGGPTRATWDGRIATPLPDSGLVGHLALNNLNDLFAITPTYLVLPGNTAASALFRRIAEMAPYHMPPLGTTVLDQAAIQLLGDWITNSLPNRAFTFSTWTNDWVKSNPTLDLAKSSDPDGDGLSNELEFLLQESPIDPNREWKPELVGAPGAWRLKFIRKANLRFDVQWSTEITNPWATVETPSNRWFVSSVDETVEVTLPSTPETAFYRILVYGP